MSFDDLIHELAPNAINVLRNERQRRHIDDDEEAALNLQRSIERNGLINPITVRVDEFGEYVLVAGERRLRAVKALGWPYILARFAHELSPQQASILELEENIARKDLTWQDTANAVNQLHTLYCDLEPEWNQIKTAGAIALSDSMVGAYLTVMRYGEDRRIMEQPTVNKALSVIKTIEGRQRESAFSALFEAREEDDLEEEDQPLPISNITTLLPPSIQKVSDADLPSLTPIIINGDTPHIAPVPSNGKRKKVRTIADDILHTSFLEWAPKYKGRRFNFIHVDFPYGVEEIGPQMVGVEHTIYQDSPDIYMDLLNCFCEHLDKFMAQSAWCIFWYSERMGQITRDTFKFKAPDLIVQHHPLIWLHSDNAGISSDHTKRPRHIYDTALFMSRGDLPLARLKSDAHACPTDRRLHPSTKPEPMLKYFFEMVVDHHTEMLDPTCGAGSSLRAAESLGAKRTLGIEANWDYVEVARRELQSQRTLRDAASGIMAAF